MTTVRAIRSFETLGDKRGYSNKADGILSVEACSAMKTGDEQKQKVM